MKEMRISFDQFDSEIRKINSDLLLDLNTEKTNIELVPIFFGKKVFVNVSWGSSCGSTNPEGATKFMNVLSKAIAEAKNFKYNGCILAK